MEDDLSMSQIGLKKHYEARQKERSPVEHGVMTKTEDLERVIGRVYIEYLKLIKAGCPNNYGETDGFTDGMEKLADIVIEREES
jgi:hypothetical protein